VAVCKGCCMGCASLAKRAELRHYAQMNGTIARYIFRSLGYFHTDWYFSQDKSPWRLFVGSATAL
jgi:hypothetical protein